MYFNKQRIDEYFTNSNNLNVSFISPLEAFNIIKDSGYFNHYNKVNFKSRNCANIDDCHLMWRQELMPIDILEKESMLYFMEILSQKVKSSDIIKHKLLFNIRGGIKMCKSSVSLEGGMPHTHKNLIVLPNYFYEELWKLYNNIKNSPKNKKEELTNYFLLNYGLTILHELTHLSQRINKNKFEKLYRQWGFQKINPLTQINDGENLLELNRINPDGLDMGYVFLYDSQYYLLMATFNTNKPKHLSDVSYLSINLEKDTTQPYSETLIVKDIKNIDKCNIVNNYFCLSNNHYHPNEICAEYVSKYFQELWNLYETKHLPSYYQNTNNDNNDDNNINNCSGYKIFKQWFQ